MDVPTDRSYTAEHEWARSGGSGIRIGITAHAQEQLGDIVFVSLPAVGSTVTAGTPCGELESTKSVSEVYAPISGTVTAINPAVETAPETINADPYDNGWMFEIAPDDPAALAGLLSAGEYQRSLES